MGKAIYNPAGKAKEYSTYACNFYTGCDNQCTYCYCKSVLRGIWTNYPRLKSCFKDQKHAIHVFTKELLNNLRELQKNGIFFSFTTDPMLEETIYLTHAAAIICAENKVPVKILTKEAWWIIKYAFDKEYVSLGFTLTGHDELETFANTNEQRINALKILHDNGYKTFASIEPIVKIPSSLNMIKQTYGICDSYLIGLLSGKKYDKKELVDFMAVIKNIKDTNVYFKNSFLKQVNE